MSLPFRLMAAALLVASAMPSAFAQSTAPADSFWTRSRLTGDWGGLRSHFVDNGVTFDLNYTSTYQGLESDTGDEDFEYGGKVDAFLHLDSGKMGLWKGGGLHTHLEYRHGDAPANLGGALFAVNIAQLYPVDDPDEVQATSLYFSQKTGDRTNIMFGKINPIDLLAPSSFFGGWGIDRFMNLIFVGPPSGLIPPVFMGAVASIQSEPVSWLIMVFDPNDRTADYFPGDLFSDGVNVSVTATHPTTLAGRRTDYGITTNYSTAEGTDFSAFQPGIDTTTRKGAYNIAFQFTHDLQESMEQSGASWGFYLRAAIADGNPNYVKASIIGGIGGRALFLGRPQDSFGLGYFYYDLSNELQEALDPLLNLQNESAVEAFYSFAVTPWLHVGGDIQYVDPADGRRDRALVMGVRTSIRF